MSPAGREGAGREAAADAPGLAQGSPGPAQMVEAERGHHQVEGLVAERQGRGIGRHRVLRRADLAQHGHGQVGGHHLGGARSERGPAGHAGARAQVEDPAAGHRERRRRDQGPGQRGIHLLRAPGPVCGRGVIGRPHLRRQISRTQLSRIQLSPAQLSRVQLSRGAACTAFASHHASSSS